MGLYRCLLPNYVGMNAVKGTTTIAKMSTLIRRGDINGALTMLQTYLATVPYCDNADSEGHYQQMTYVIFSILNHYVDVEVHTLCGRVDMMLRTATHLYLPDFITFLCRHIAYIENQGFEIKNQVT